MLEEITQKRMMQKQKTIKTDQADLKTDNMYYLWTLNMNVKNSKATQRTKIRQQTYKLE